MSPPAMPQQPTDRQYLGVVLPFMISTLTQPLMGAVNTAVMGRLPDPAYISGVALGAVLFNTIYWFFGFLRVGTTGYAAQALGSGRIEDQWTAFGRPLVVCLAASALILLGREPILDIYLDLIAPAPDVAALTRAYYDILIWGTPLTLFNYVALGWLMGQARIRASLFMQISTNLLNIVLCLVLVLHLQYEVAGVAAASLIAQVYGTLIGLWLMRANSRFGLKDASLRLLIRLKPMAKMLSTNANLMIRTACLLVVNNLFAATSASFGTEVLAANAVLLQVLALISFLIDGMANGNSLFVGRAVGRGDQALFEQTRRMSLKWLAVLALTLVGLYGLGGRALLGVFTGNESVLQLAGQYDFYIMAYPFCAGLGLTFYGLFTGATFTAPIRDMMFLAMLCFATSRFFLAPVMGNHGLWISYLLFYGSQSVIIGLFLPRLRGKTGFVKVVGV